MKFLEVVPEAGDLCTVTVGRYRNVRGKIREIINDDLVLVDVLVPAQLAVRAGEVRLHRPKESQGEA